MSKEKYKEGVDIDLTYFVKEGKEGQYNYIQIKYINLFEFLRLLDLSEFNEIKIFDMSLYDILKKSTIYYMKNRKNSDRMNDQYYLNVDELLKSRLGSILYGYLNCAFVWMDAPEQHYYWSTIANCLSESFPKSLGNYLEMTVNCLYPDE